MLEEKELEKLRQLSELLTNSGFTGIRYQVDHTVTKVTGIRKQSLVKVQDSSDIMYVIEAVQDGKCGRIYCSHLPPFTVIKDQLKKTADVSEKNLPIYQYPIKNVKRPPAFIWESHGDVKEHLVKAEMAAYAYPEAALVETCTFEQEKTDIYLLDESGICLQDSTGYHCIKAAVIVRKDGQTEYARACCYGSSLKEFDGGALIGETAKEAIGNLGGRPVASGNYQVILKNNVMAEILEAYVPAFYADKIKDEQSGLSGPTGEMIAAAAVMIGEVPDSRYGRITRSIDDEGTDVQRKYLIDHGRFVTELSNRRTASESHYESTGNGFKSSIKSEVAIGVTNIILKSAEMASITIDDIIAEMGDGLFVTGVDGVFAGTDVKSGAISLIARGRIIVDGKVAGSFREVTIAGNFYHILKDIKKIGTDYTATWPDCACVIAPSVFVGTLAISGN